MIIIFAVVIVLLSISLLHFYWAFGGTWALENAIPKKFRTNYLDLKTKIATIIVALGLIVFAIIVASNHLDFTWFLKTSYTALGTKIIAGIFLIRAIGDFNMFGIFKKPGDDIFTKSDTKIYVPLCLFLGISLVVISIL